jgi:lipid-binding SYLF domain-containing protein
MAVSKKALLAISGALLSFALLEAPAVQDKGTWGPGAERVENAIAAFEDMTKLSKSEQAIPPWLLGKAQGLAVFPGVVKAAYGIGGQYGRGILMIKDDRGQWSDPVFASLIGGSIGWQIGVQKSDIVLVFRSRKTLEYMSTGKLTLGADASVAAGPVGRQAEASTDLQFQAEIFSYSKSKGLFAGISIKGAGIQVDRDADSAFYGRSDISPYDIFKGEGIKAPPVVDRLKATLAKYSQSVEK